MKTAATIIATASCIAAWTTVTQAQAVERGVLLAVAADIGKEPGKLLGIGPNPDSANTRLPHQILVDTSLACSKGPNTCTGFGSAETLALYRLLAPVMKAKVNTGGEASPASNKSYYRFSEVTARGDTAEVRVLMGWSDWVTPNYGHIVTALYVVARGPDATWRVEWRGHPSRRERL